MKQADFRKRAFKKVPQNGSQSGENAVISIFVSITFLAVLAIFSLLNDGAAIRNGRRRLADLAGQAARAAAQEIDINALRATGELTLDFERARNKALAVLGQEDIQTDVDVLKDQVMVTVWKKVELWGGREFNLKARRVARATTNFLPDQAFAP